MLKTHTPHLLILNKLRGCVTIRFMGNHLGQQAVPSEQSMEMQYNIGFFSALVHRIDNLYAYQERSTHFNMTHPVNLPEYNHGRVHPSLTNFTPSTTPSTTTITSSIIPSRNLEHELLFIIEKT